MFEQLLSDEWCDYCLATHENPLLLSHKMCIRDRSKTPQEIRSILVQVGKDKPDAYTRQEIEIFTAN